MLSDSDQDEDIDNKSETGTDNDFASNVPNPSPRASLDTRTRPRHKYSNSPKLSISSQVRAYYSSSESVGQQNLETGLSSIHSNSWPGDKPGLLSLKHGISLENYVASAHRPISLLKPIVKDDAGVDLVVEVKRTGVNVASIPAEPDSSRSVGQRESESSVLGLGRNESTRSNLGLDSEPRERKRWVKPIPMEYVVSRKELFGNLPEATFEEDVANFETSNLAQQTSSSNPARSTTDTATEQDSGSSKVIGNNNAKPTNVKAMSSTGLPIADVDKELKLSLDVSLDTSGHRIPSPSSSITSNKRGLEWDSGADVGYRYHSTNDSKANLSTIERLVLARGSAAFQFDTGSLPENLNRLEAAKYNDVGELLKPGDPFQLSSDTVLSKKDAKLGKASFSQYRDIRPIVNESDTTPLRERLAREIEAFKASKDASLKEPLAQSTPLDPDRRVGLPPLQTTQKDNVGLSPVISSGLSKKRSLSLTDIHFSSVTTDECTLTRVKSGASLSTVVSENPCSSQDKRSQTNLIGLSTQNNELVDSNSQTNRKFIQVSKLSVFPTHLSGVQAEKTNKGTNNINRVTDSEKPISLSMVDAKKFIENIQKNAAVHQQAINKIKTANTYPRTSRNEQLIERKKPFKSSTADLQNSEIPDTESNLNKKSNQVSNVCNTDCKGAHKKGSTSCKYSEPPIKLSSSSGTSQASRSSSSCDFIDLPISVNATNDRDTIGSANSFEYLPGHVYENANVKAVASGSRNVSLTKNESWGFQSHTLVRELEEGVNNFRNIINQKSDVNTKQKKMLIRQFVQKILDNDYCEDYESSVSESSPPDGSDAGDESEQAKPRRREEPRAISEPGSKTEYADKNRQFHKHTTGRPKTGANRRDMGDSYTSNRNYKYYIGLNSTDSVQSSSDTTRSNSAVERRDWRQPITQSEKRLERSRETSSVSKTYDSDTQSEELAQINKKINHLSNLKMILERQDQLREYLLIENRKLQTTKKHRNLYTVMTAQVNTGNEKSAASSDNREEETSVDEMSDESLDVEKSTPSEADQPLYTNWSSHVHLANHRTTNACTQIPNTATGITDQQNEPSNQRNVQQSAVNNLKQRSTQTSSSNTIESSDTSLDHRAKRGRINVYSQTKTVDSGRNRHDRYKDVDPLCCCECEKKLLRLKEATKICRTKSTSTSSHDADSCCCKCHARKAKYIYSIDSSADITYKEKRPTEKVRRCECEFSVPPKNMHTSTPHDVCHNCNCPFLNDRVSDVRENNRFCETPRRNVERNSVATYTIDNKQVQTSETRLPDDVCQSCNCRPTTGKDNPSNFQENVRQTPRDRPINIVRVRKYSVSTSTITTGNKEVQTSESSSPYDVSKNDDRSAKFQENLIRSESSRQPPTNGDTTSDVPKSRKNDIISNMNKQVKSSGTALLHNLQQNNSQTPRNSATQEVPRSREDVATSIINKQVQTSENAIQHNVHPNKSPETFQAPKNSATDKKDGSESRKDVDTSIMNKQLQTSENAILHNVHPNNSSRTFHTPRNSAAGTKEGSQSRKNIVENKQIQTSKITLSSNADIREHKSKQTFQNNEKRSIATNTIENKRTQTSDLTLPIVICTNCECPVFNGKTSNLSEHERSKFCHCQTPRSIITCDLSRIIKNIATSMNDTSNRQAKTSERAMSNNLCRTCECPVLDDKSTKIPGYIPSQSCRCETPRRSNVYDVPGSGRSMTTSTMRNSERAMPHNLCVTCKCPVVSDKTSNNVPLKLCRCEPPKRSNIYNVPGSGNSMATSTMRNSERPVPHNVCQTCKCPVVNDKASKIAEDVASKSCRCESPRITITCDLTRTSSSTSTSTIENEQAQTSEFVVPLPLNICRTCNCYVLGDKITKLPENVQSKSCRCNTPRNITPLELSRALRNVAASEHQSARTSALPINKPLWFASSNNNSNHEKTCPCCRKSPAAKSPRHLSPIRSQQERNVCNRARSDQLLDRRCSHCRKRNITVCLCMTKDDEPNAPWDISSINVTSNTECKKPPPMPVAYFLTFEETSVSESSSSETVVKRSLEEVRMKLPTPRSRASRKQKYERDTSKPWSERRSSRPTRGIQCPSPMSSDEQIRVNARYSCPSSCSDRGTLEEVTLKIPKKKQEQRHERHPSSRLTLQEYLRRNRPDYVESADYRRKCLSELARMREQRHESRQRALALASRPPGTLIDVEKMATSKSLPPPPLAMKRVFNQQAMLRQTRKNREKCVEVLSKKAEQKRKEDYRTNRLMAEIFTRKLQRNVLKGGPIDLSNSVSVISTLAL